MLTARIVNAVARADRPIRIRGCKDRHILDTARLRIRPAVPGWTEEFLATIDEEVRFWQGYTDASLEEYRAALSSLAPAEEQRRTCPTWFFVWEKTTGALVGNYGFDEPKDPDPIAPTLGWWFGPQARGRGYGVESLRAVLDYAHSHLHQAVVMATSDSNARARRQIEAMHAEFVGTGEHLRPNGELVLSRWYRHAASR